MFASYSAVESALLATAVAFATHWACAKFNYGAGGLTGAVSAFGCILQREVVASFGKTTGDSTVGNNVAAGLVGAAVAYNVIAVLAENKESRGGRKTAVKEE
jgi:hypothetical protein